MDEDVCISNGCVAREDGLYVCSRSFTFIGFSLARTTDEVYSVRVVKTAKQDM